MYTLHRRAGRRPIISRPSALCRLERDRPLFRIDSPRRLAGRPVGRRQLSGVDENTRCPRLSLAGSSAGRQLPRWPRRAPDPRKIPVALGRPAGLRSRYCSPRMLDPGRTTERARCTRFPLSKWSGRRCKIQANQPIVGSGRPEVLASVRVTFLRQTRCMSRKFSWTQTLCKPSRLAIDPSRL